MLAYRNKLNTMLEIRLKQENDTPATVSYKGILNKNHVRLKKAGSVVEKLRLEAAELVYLRILGVARKLYSGLPDPTDRTVYEQDHTMNRGNLDLMHTFITPTFFFQLRCDYSSITWIDYYFWNCPFEEELTKLLNEGGIVTMIHEQTIKTYYPDFYKNVMGYQDKKYIYVL